MLGRILVQEAHKKHSFHVAFLAETRTLGRSSLWSKMSKKRTMSLNLTDAEMMALEDLATRKELSKTAVIRQALRLYQMLDQRMSKGEKLYLEDEAEKKKAELMVL